MNAYITRKKRDSYTIKNRVRQFVFCFFLFAKESLKVNDNTKGI